MVIFRQLGINSEAGAKSIEKLSSGYRINRAGDDAAGLAISEKMRSQVRGLNQASRNAQDGISLIQTAEGALNESQAILQRMRELAVQSANDTNVDADRTAIQNEIDQLVEEIDRIAGTTEFNTQSLLKGDGSAALDASGVFATDVSATGAAISKTQSTTTVAFTGAVTSTDNMVVSLNGIDLTITFTDDIALTGGEMNYKADSATSTSATIEFDDTGAGETAAAVGTAFKDALEAVIAQNDTLKDQYSVSVDGAGLVTIKAVAGGTFDGNLGNISVTDGMTAASTVLDTVIGATTAAQPATTNVDFQLYPNAADVQALVGTGFTINGTAFEFYDANAGAYEGDAVGVNVSDALAAADGAADEALANAVAEQVAVSGDFTAAVGTTTNTVDFTSVATGADASIEITDGSVQEDFSATFQIGANELQTMEVTIGDMRAAALGIEGVDISTSTAAQAAITTVDNALSTVSDERAKLGAFQNRLEHTIKNLDTSSENLQASESRIRDVDMAKEMMEFTKNNILQQAAQAMLAQANQAPQGVLQLLR